MTSNSAVCYYEGMEHTAERGTNDVTAPKGKRLTEHMQEAHGFVAWNTPAPNGREYKQWQASHTEECPGRWADQQDHDHSTAEEG